MIQSAGAFTLSGFCVHGIIIIIMIIIGVRVVIMIMIIIIIMIMIIIIIIIITNPQWERTDPGLSLSMGMASLRSTSPRSQAATVSNLVCPQLWVK